MDLKLLAISDTHVGEDTSLLSYPQGRQHLWKALREHFGGDAARNDERYRVPVEELVLVGDILDRTLSSTAEVITHTNALVQTLGSALDVKKAVYVPGNHDHTIWTKYRKARNGAGLLNALPQGTGPHTTAPGGEAVVSEGCALYPSPDGSIPVTGELVSLFYGYPDGSSWRAIKRKGRPDLFIANPLYATVLNDPERLYVFTHGTHFRWEFSQAQWIRKAIDALELDQLIGRIELDTELDPAQAPNLDAFEEAVGRFADSLWPSCRNNPAPHSDRLWYLYNRISGQFEQQRPYPPTTELFSWPTLPDVPPDRLPRLTDCRNPAHESLVRWRQHCEQRMFEFLGCPGGPMKGNTPVPVTFVYGDTHSGGWGELRLPGGGDMRVYNTGAWVVTHPGSHPACQVFAVDTNGQEYILDISFEGAIIDDTPLLKVAGEDLEHRQLAVGKALRMALEALPVG